MFAQADRALQIKKQELYKHSQKKQGRKFGLQLLHMEQIGTANYALRLLCTWTFKNQGESLHSLHYLSNIRYSKMVLHAPKIINDW